jgi:TonB family protein
MLDSTARAERIDLPSSEAPCYIWEVAQKPVAVRLPLPLIDRLESEAVENFRSLSSRGSEIGGLLLGSSAQGSPAIVTVADFELISCDYTRGPLYRLGDSDIARFQQAFERYGKGATPKVIGYFRSHTRKGLSLDADDLAFFEPHFPDAQQIVLLVRPFATKVSTAGIFIRENGKINGEASYREFSFRASELTATRGGDKQESASASAPAQNGAQPALPPKPASRAQIVPIASRREITLPDPIVSTPANPLATPETAAPAAPKAQAAAPAVETPVEEKPVVEKAAAEKVVVEKPAVEKPAAEKPAVDKSARQKDEKPKEKEKAAAPPPAKPVETAVKAAPALETSEIVLPVPEKKNKKLRLVVAAAAMLVLVVGGLVVYPMLVKHNPASSASGPQDSSPLSLRVERTSGGMLLTWNRDLPVIQSATKVVLSISDGDRHENIELDPNQVRTGSILYPPISGDVSFQMEVTDPHQTKTTSESLRVLDPRPSPLDQPSATPAATSAKETAPAAKQQQPAASEPAPTATEEAKSAEDAPVSRPAANLKPFNSASLNSPTLAQRLRPVSSNDLPEAPPVVSASQTDSINLPGVVNTQASVPAPPKPVIPTPAPAPKVGGQLVSARVIAKVDPEYPKLARQAGASGVVELEATISVDGKVKNPRVVRGNSMLQKAAIDAVLQWRYQPATLNGKPVESPVEIKLNFVAQGR